KMGGQQFLVPDNGLLGLVAERHPAERIVAVTNRSLWAEQVSHTFHGRDIFSPVAARVCLGRGPSAHGSPPAEVLAPGLAPAVVQGRSIRGEVIAVDAFGNLITNIRVEHCLQVTEHFGEAVVHCGSREISGIIRTYGERRSGDLVALIGSSGRLEVAVVNG